jgi:hypothetical protein
MREFRLYDNYFGWTESGFRSRYNGDVRKGIMRCCGGMPDKDWCTNECNFLMAAGIENVDDEGYFPIFGMGCDVEIISWGGDVEEAAMMVYCKDCAAAMHKGRIEREREEEIEYQNRVKMEQQQRVGKERKKRPLLEFWHGLSDIDFEFQCAQLFRDLGFEAETTSITNDGGIDIILRKNGKRGAVQCKAWRQPCPVKEVREFYGVICAEKMEFGYFIAKSGFTNSAELWLKRTAIIQGWDINHLVEHALKKIS